MRPNTFRGISGGMLLGIALFLLCFVTQIACPPYPVNIPLNSLAKRQVIPFRYFEAQIGEISAASAGNYTTLNNPTALGLWITIASKIRLSLRGSSAYLPLTNATSPTAQISTFITYYIPLFVFVGVLILLIIFTLVSYCCSACCPRLGCLKFKYTTVHSKKEKIWGWVIFFIHFLFVAVGTVGLCWGAAYVALCVGLFQTSFTSLITDTNSLALGLAPAANSSFTILESGVVTAANIILNFANQTYLQTQVQTPLYNFANSIDNLNSSITYLNSNVSIATTYQANMIALAGTISATITSLNSLMSGLVNNQQSITGNNAEFYQVNAGVLPPSIDPSSMNTQVNNVPSPSSSFSAIASLSLTSYAATARNTSSTVISTAVSSLQNGSQAFTNNIIPLLETARISLVDSLSNFSNTSVIPSTSSLQATVNSFVNPITSTTNINLINYGLIGVGVAIGIIPLISAGSVLFKKTSILKVCVTSALPLFLVLQLLSVIFVIVSVVFGDVCTLAFGGNPYYIGSAISGGDMVAQALRARDQCYNGSSLLQVAINFNLVNASSVNFTQQAINQINSANYSSLTTFDTTNATSLGTAPSVKLAPLINLNTSNISTSALNTLLDTTLPNFQQAVTTYSQAVTTLSTNAVDTQLTFTPNAAPPGVDKTNAVTDFKAILTQQVLANYVAWINGNLTYLNGNATALNTTVSTLITSGSAISTQSSTVVTSYNSVTAAMQTFQTQTIQNVNSGIVSIQNLLIASAVQVNTDLDKALSCQAIATDLFNVQNTICTGIMSGFDSIYLALATLSVTSAFSLIVYIYLSKSVKPGKKAGQVNVLIVQGGGNPYVEEDELLDEKRQNKRKKSILNKKKQKVPPLEMETPYYDQPLEEEHIYTP